MSQLLVNAPSGVQDVIEVGPGGGYFDPSRVIWDEREDGPLPEITLGGMVRNGDALEFSQARMDATAAVGAQVPQSVPMAEARKALILAGISEEMIDAAIEGIEDPTERALARVDWSHQQRVRRQSPLVTSLAPALGLTSEQVDALFITAAGL